ncbi:TasA family protein [Pengzhenrongella phosphoraccumulans]|uniref:TasA family protein n=1 Tax=Pengzhenrongella phosphoraccumulans TaxID=3114394 RepID=UPI00388DF444
MDDLLQEMIQPAGPTGHDRARRRRLVMSAATVGLAVIGVTSLTTSALFTDNDAADSNLFTTGSVNIANLPAATILTSDNLAPGDNVWGPVTVSNDGSLALRYAVNYAVADKTTGTDGALLSSQLGVTIDKVADTAACSPVDGPAVGSVHLATVAAGEAKLVPTDIIGTTGVGKSTGANTELEILANGKADVLCVGLHMSIDAGNQYQKTSANLTLTFNAEQTAHN